MHDITPDAVVIGVDTHKEVHVAVAINGLGVRLATASFPVTSEGYRQVAAWAAEVGTPGHPAPGQLVAHEGERVSRNH